MTTGYHHYTFTDMDNTPSPTPVFVPLMEAAFALGVNYDVARRLLLQGRVKGARQSGHWFVDKADLERYQRTHAPTETT